MTKNEAIKKYKLEIKKNKDNFEKNYNIECWERTIITPTHTKTISMTNEFSRVMQDQNETFFLIINTVDKTKYNKKTHYYKTIHRIYTIKGE